MWSVSAVVALSLIIPERVDWGANMVLVWAGTEVGESRACYSAKSPTLLLRLVPGRKPEPLVCFWRMTPLKESALPPAGGVTDPLKVPLDLLSESESLLLPRLVTLFFASMAMVAAWPNPLTVVLALFVIGGRQLGMSILMHEASHRTLFRDRALNDWAGNWLAAYPVWTDLAPYRPYHLRHHAKTWTACSGRPDIPRCTSSGRARG